MDQPAKDGFRAAADIRTPWRTRSQQESAPCPPVALTRPGSGAAMAFGLERRLPRRAETMWEQLARSPGLPPALAAAQFLRAPYGGDAMQIRRRADGSVEIESIGEGLQSVSHLPRGPFRPADGGTTALGLQIVELAHAALACGAPRRLESERMAQRPTAGRPHLLLRAVALPFAVDENGESLAAVVTSWRKLLSAEETAALHRELAAAMDWMHRQRPRD